MKLLTEPEAWREIAERFVMKPADRFDALCLELAALNDEERISNDVYNRGLSRVRAHLDGTYAYLTPEHEARALAALWLALEAESNTNHTRRTA